MPKADIIMPSWLIVEKARTRFRSLLVSAIVAARKAVIPPTYVMLVNHG